MSDLAQREPALALLADMLARPSFPAALLAREKAQMLTALREAEDDPAGRGERALRRLMYGAHPYALSARINADSVRRISRDDVLRFWRAHYTARRAVVSLVGDISRADAERIAEQLTPACRPARTRSSRFRWCLRQRRAGASSCCTAAHKPICSWACRCCGATTRIIFPCWSATMCWAAAVLIRG